LKNTIFTRLFCVLALISLLVFSGCGPDVKKQRKAAALINSFETLPSELSIGDFDLDTNGYVQLEQIKKYASQGKFSAKATFSVPVDFLTTTQAAKAKTWISAVTMGINTLSALKNTEWNWYKKFAVDVYVLEQSAPDVFIKIVDQYGNQYLAQRQLKNGRNKLEVVLEEVKAARLNLNAITSFSIYMDTIGQAKDVTVYLDNIRLVL
jgi:hypothetical protein